MVNSIVSGVYHRSSMSEVRKLIDELELVKPIVEVENVAGSCVVILKFSDGFVSRVVYSTTIADRLFRRSVA